MRFEKMNVLDICKWFMDKHEDINLKSFNGNVKLQKLLYYTQVMSLSVSDNEIFDNSIEAWKHGPVVPEAFKFYEYEIDEIRKRKINVSESNERLLNIVNSLFGFKTAKELEDISHNEEPWLELKDKVDRRLNPIITQDKIKSYYKNMKEIFNSFTDFDFENETAEYINNNVFVYNKLELMLGEDDKMILYDISEQVDNQSYYVYKENGELVVY